MSKNLSQILADLFAKPTEGNELSPHIQHLGIEIRKVVHSEDTMFGRFSGLLESFRTIIPDEKQRYQAALQALSTTSKLSRQEILKAMGGQLEELKIVETGLMPAQSAWRDELTTMDARSQGLQGEIANLRARMAQLEGEERTVQAAMAARQKDLEGAEKTIKQLLADIGAEISALKKKLEEWTADTPAAEQAQPAAQPSPKKEPPRESQQSDVSGKKKDVEHTSEIEASSPQQDTKFQRKCPMCGGPFHLLELENIWQCYTCAYEEPNK